MDASDQQAIAQLHQRPDGSRLLGVSPLKLAKRKATDGAFSACYLLCFVATIGFGGWGYSHNNLESLANGMPSECTQPSAYEYDGSASQTAHVARRLASATSSTDWEIVRQHTWYLFPTGAVLLLAGMGMVQCFRHCARAFVYASMLMIPLSLFATAGAFFSAGEHTGASITLAFGVLYLLFLWCCRSGLRLCAALLEQAATVLMLHPGILFASAVLLLLGLLLFSLSLTAGALLFSNGQWIKHTSPGGSTYCTWAVDPMALYGLSLTIFVALWSFFLTFTLRFFVVSLVTSCWYFDTSAGGGAVLSGGSGDDVTAVIASRRRAPICTAFKLAFSSSFGTLCFSSLVLTICEILKGIAREAMRRSDNLLVVLVACCLRCLLDCIEFLTKFAICMHAITGDSFCASARVVSDSLGRHGLNAWFCDRISAFVLHMSTLAFSTLAAASLYQIILIALADDDKPSTTAQDRYAIAGGFAGVAFLLGIVILQACSSILLNIVDSAYTCLAIDMDAGAPHQPQIRDAMIPIVKPDYIVIVQQPGNGQHTAMATPVGGAPRVVQGRPVDSSPA